MPIVKKVTDFSDRFEIQYFEKQLGSGGVFVFAYIKLL
jgi:hypothetical protein